MFYEIKPRKAKFAFKMDLTWDIKFNPRTFVNEVLGEPPTRVGKLDSDLSWFDVFSNDMGRQHYVIYINDEAIYQTFKTALEKKK